MIAPDPNSPAMRQLIQALAEHLVQEHLTAKPALAQEKPALRQNHGRVADAGKAA
jgi:hypothetical protein